jgi:C4-dicarboxylate-binding protein DctP
MNGRLLLFVLLSLLPATGGAEARQIRLKVGLQTSVANPYYGVSVMRFKEEVERQSKGDIILEIVDNARLYRDEEVVSALASGAIDIGTASSHSFADKVPAVAILNQPFLFNFGALVRAAASPESDVRKLIDEVILTEIGVRILWWQSLGDNLIFSKGRDVADPERINGQRVGTPGRTLAEFIVRCGADPAVIPEDTLHLAARRGAVDMLLVAQGAFEDLRLWEVTDTITRTSHAPVELFVGINEEAWQSLPVEHRTLIMEAAATVEREMRDVATQLRSRAFGLAAVKGMKVHDLTPDEVADWRACSAEMLADYMDRNGAIAQRLMAAYRKLRSDPCCMEGPSEATFTRR